MNILVRKRALISFSYISHENTMTTDCNKYPLKYPLKFFEEDVNT